MLSLPLFYLGLSFASSSNLLGLAWAQSEARHSAPSAVVYQVEERSMPLLLKGIASFGGAVQDHWLYVYGGHTGRAHTHTTANINTSFRRLNLLDGATWEELPFGRKLQGTALVSDSRYLYLIGGMEPLSSPEVQKEDRKIHSTDEVRRFDPATKEWRDLPALPMARSSHDAMVLDNKLYVIGGWRLHEEEEEIWHETALVMDLKKPEQGWKEIAQPPFQRRALAVAAFDKWLFVIGGLTEFGELSSSVDVYDTEERVWRKAPDLPYAGFGVSAFGQPDGVYFSGMKGSMYRLEHPDSSWEHTRDLKIARFFHRLLPHGDDELIAVGGAAMGGHARVIEYLPLKESQTHRVSKWKVPFPGVAKNRQGLLMRGHTLYAFGGNNSLGQHDFAPKNFLNETWKIDLHTHEVEKLDEFPVYRQSMATLTMHASPNARGPFHGSMPGMQTTHGFAVGGFGHDGEVARSHDQLWKFDFKEESWTALPTKLPTPRTQFELAHHGGYLWVFGGLNYDPRFGDSPRSPEAFRYEMEVLRWNMEDGQAFESVGTKLPHPRRAFAGAVVGDSYYLIGGMKENFELVEECDVFDLNSHQWSTIPSPSAPRLSPEVVVLNDKIFIAGGSSPGASGGFASNSTLEMFDPQTGQWTVVLDELPVPVRHMQMLAWGSSLMFYTLHSETPHMAQIAVLDLAETLDQPVF